MTPEPPKDTEPPPAPKAEPSVGVLAALPRRRPQRPSARRAAARIQAQPETASETPAATPARRTARAAPGKAKAASAKKPPTKRAGASKKSPRPAPASARGEGKPSGGRKPSRRPAPPVAENVPRQGYEPEEEIELGNTVHPPSGGELIESLADIFGELASAGAGAGGRLLKDALSIFRRP